jgi:hypothetical protein
MPRNPSRLLGRVVIASLVLFPAAAFAQGAMSNGENHTGTISAAGEVDSWTFTATAGDAIVLGIGEVGADSAFVPWIRLIRPDAVLAGNQSGTLAAQIEIVAPLTGTYTVQVASGDVGQNDTGSYTLTLAKAPGAFSITGGDHGGEMTNGSNHTGSIHVGDLDMWSFSATAGDAIIIGIGEVGPDSTFRPWIRLKSPTGQNLGSQANVLAAQIEAVATVTGVYTVVVSTGDVGLASTGDYTLTLALAPGAFTISGGDDGGAMTNGSNHAGSIHVGDLDMWSFSATAGESIIIGIGEVGLDSPFRPWIRLKSPTGQNLGSQANVLADQIEAVATVTGVYTVVVSSGDVGLSATGDYTLTLAKSPGAFTISGGDEGGAMTNGSNHAASIHVGDLDMWSFSAVAGESIIIGIGEVGADSPFRPWIRLKSPTGQNLGSEANILATQIEAVATVTGVYTVVVSSGDVGLSATGEYTLTLAKSPGAFTISGGDHGGAMTNGSNHTGSIHVGDLDMWSFSAIAGESIIIGIGEVGADSPFRPWIRLKSPTGQNLGSEANILATQIEAVATVTGVYTVVVSSGDVGLAGTGAYTLTLAKAPGVFTISEEDEGGPMTNGSNHTGSIHVGDLDMWSFFAVAGEALTVGIGEVGLDSPFRPWIRLKSPTGQNLGSESGILAQQINATATVTGNYTVVVASGDVGLDATGDYTLTIANTPRAFVISGGDDGGPLVGGSQPGAIHIGDVDMWTFAAHAGDPLVVDIAEVGSTADFAPWIRLRSPTGALIGSQSGAAGAQINVSAPLTGTYTVIVASGDAGLDSFGDYILSVTGTSDSMIRNGTFDEGETFWKFFATPNLTYIVHSVVNGVLEYYRVPPPPGTGNQAVAFQETGVSLPELAPVRAQFDLANTSPVRKRISVLILNADFSDLSVCTFWLAPNAPMRTYVMRTHTTQAWTNAALYFYAASAGSNGGVYQVDNVSMAYVPEQADDRTDCVDPTAPAPPGGASSVNFVGNGDFETGSLPPWFVFGTITSQITAGVFEFVKPTSTSPSGVVAQPTGQAMAVGEILTATFQLGNSSGLRKRVTAILHDSDFSDLSACTFWLAPGQPLSTYTYRTFTTKAWANAMVSIYPATVGVQQWIRLDNVTFQRTPAASTVGTECIEPSEEADALLAALASTGDASLTASSADSFAPIGDVAALTARAPASGDGFDLVAAPAGASVGWQTRTIDLRGVSAVSLSFESWRGASRARAMVEASRDGVTWVALQEVPAFEHWTTIEIDLRAFAGEVIQVRFVLDAGDAAVGEVWRTRHVRVLREPGR